MLNLSKELANAKTIGISGHIRPDGDCVGSTMGLYLYIKKTKPEADVHIFLEEPSEVFSCIKDVELIEDAEKYSGSFDMFFAVDCGKERLGAAERLFDEAKCTINIDHHVSNPGTGHYNYIVPDASSASELVYDILNRDSMDEDIAKALYIGIIHDCGVMQYSNTSPKTLRVVADLISYGFDFPKLIDETFYEKTFLQTKVMGKVLEESFLCADGKVSVGICDLKTMEEYDVKPKDLDGIVNQLRTVKGVEVAMFMYQLPTLEYKVSLRSNGRVDVAKIAKSFDGGGHVRAAGCTLSMDKDAVVKEVTALICEQIKD